MSGIGLRRGVISAPVDFIQTTGDTADAVDTFNAQLDNVGDGNTLVLMVSSSGASVGAAPWGVPTDSTAQIWLPVTGNANANGNNGADPVLCSAYYLLGANAGTHALAFAMAPGHYASWSLTEIPACTAPDVETTNSGNTVVTGGDTGTTGVTTQANCAVFVAVGTNTDSVSQADAQFSDPALSGYDSLFTEDNTSAHIGAQHSYKGVVATGTQTGSWTWLNNAQTTWKARIVTFKYA